MKLINCQYRHLCIVARQRNHPISRARKSIHARNGEEIVVDVESPYYPARQRHALGGPGAELKKLLSRLGISAGPTCSCNARARKMDEMEAESPGWCQEHIDEITGWLREEATKRRLPFVNAVGRMLVSRAIRNARKSFDEFDR